MDTTKRLADLICGKHRVLRQLCDVGRRQTEIVSGGDIGSLLKLLAAKQQLIGTLQAVEHELAPYYAENPEKRNWASAEERADCARQVAECNALLEEIVRLEKLGVEKMTVRRDEVAEQLHQVHSATQVRGAYEANRIGRAS